MTIEFAKRRRVVRIVAVVVLASLAGCDGCSIFDDMKLQNCRVAGSWRLATTLKSDGNDYFLGATAKKDGGLFDARVDWDLHVPYNISASGGYRTQAGAEKGLNTIFGLELDYMNSSPLDFHGLFARYTAGGTQVFATKTLGGMQTNLGQLFFSGATEVDYAIDNNGTNMTFWARPRGTMSYQLVTSQPAPTDTRPLHAALGAFSMTKGQQMVFDNYNIFNGPLPASPPPDDHTTIRDLTFRAKGSMLDSFYRLDAFPRDYAGARSSLVISSSEQQALAIGFQLRFKAPNPNAMLKMLNTAKSKIDSAIAQIDAGKATTEKGRKKVLDTIKAAVTLDVKVLKLLSKLPQ